MPRKTPCKCQWANGTRFFRSARTFHNSSSAITLHSLLIKLKISDCNRDADGCIRHVVQKCTARRFVHCFPQQLTNLQRAAVFRHFLQTQQEKKIHPLGCLTAEHFIACQLRLSLHPCVQCIHQSGYHPRIFLSTHAPLYVIHRILALTIMIQRLWQHEVSLRHQQALKMKYQIGRNTS